MGRAQGSLQQSNANLRNGGDETAIGDRIDSLAQELRHNSHLYYLGKEVISDAEYDALEQEFRGLIDAHPEMTPADNPLEEVGASLAGELFDDVRHEVPMLSLEKAHTPEQLDAFLTRFPDQKFSLQPKFDGLSLSLLYRKGRLVRAATRGDGETGQDVTVNIKGVQGIVTPLPEPLDCEIRGELVMLRSDFDAYNKAHPEKTLANPRNGAAGTMLAKDREKVKDRPLTFQPFEVIVLAGDLKDGLSQRDILEGMGFAVEGYAEASSAEEITAFIENTEATRPNVNYELDGVVIKLADRKDYEGAGATGSHPKGAIAYKLAPEVAETVLLDVDWRPGKTGQLTPRGRVSPVFVAGTTIEYVTLHNLSVIGERDIRIGDRVFIQRAGDVIPFVSGPVDTSKRDGSEKGIEAPQICPSCGGPLIEIGDSRILHCENTQGCPSQKLRRLSHWSSRAAADVEGLSEKRLGQLTDAGLIDHNSDLYKLTHEDLMPGGTPAVEGMGERSVQNLLDAVEESKNVGLRKAIVGWSIPLCSEGTAKRLCRAGYESIEDVQAASFEDLLKIEDIGPEVATSLQAFLAQPDTQEEINSLRAAGVNLDVLPADRPVKASSSPLAGKSIVITGTLSKGRKEVQADLEATGAKASSSISAKTDYLVVGENAGSKLAKAESLGVKVITEAEAYAMLAG